VTHVKAFIRHPVAAYPSAGTGRRRRVLTATLAMLACLSFFPVAHAQDAASLRARHEALRESLATNPFHQALHLSSHQAPDSLQGDIYAQIEQPYAVVGPALRGADHWCDILILHLNVKRCRASVPTAGQAGSDRLSVNIGRKFDQPPEEAYHFEFIHKVVESQPDYLQITLNADAGPLGTRNYRVVLEVVALDARRSFIHLSYSYEYGVTARVAMTGYLATVGRDKVGFSIVGKHPDGRPVYIGGMRGVVERNTMRYYLAIASYLGALSVPAPQQPDKRLNDWHTAVERFPIQLHELERTEYLDMKHKEMRASVAPEG
jgi:hypothetical protein